QDLQRELGGAALRQQLCREVQIDVRARGQLDGGLRRVAGPLELLSTPLLHELWLSQADGCLGGRHQMVSSVICSVKRATWFSPCRGIFRINGIRTEAKRTGRTVMSLSLRARSRPLRSRPRRGAAALQRSGCALPWPPAAAETRWRPRL